MVYLQVWNGYNQLLNLELIVFCSDNKANTQ